MTRVTSAIAFQKIKDDGLLAQRKWEVYETVYYHGPLTSAEAFNIMNKNKPVRNITQSRARFTELRDMGVLKEVGVRRCKITGHKVIEWDVTDQLPRKREKPKTHKEKKKDILNRMRSLDPDIALHLKPEFRIIYTLVEDL